MQPNEHLAIAAAVEEMNARQRELAATPLPEPAPQGKTFPAEAPDSRNSGVNSSGLPMLGGSEMAKMQESLIASQRELLLNGKITQAESEAFQASVANAAKADGYTSPTPPSADATAARDYGVNLEAKPSDYRFDPWSPRAPKEDTQVELGELWAGLKLGAGDGRFLSEHLREEGARMKTMSDMDRIEYVAKNDTAFADFVTKRGGDPAKVNQVVKEMLASHPLGQAITDGMIFSSPTLKAILSDHALAYRAFKQSRK